MPKIESSRYSINEKVTCKGLVAISERLHFLEYLALPDRVGNELGLPGFDWIDDRIWQTLPYTINLSKMNVLKSIKTLKNC